MSVGLPEEASLFVTLVQKAIRHDGKERTITQKVPVRDAGVCARISHEVPIGAEIEATIVTEWHKNGYSAYLQDFCLVAPSSANEQTPSILATTS